MLRLTIKGLWAHKLRYALTGLAVVLGVAFMAGTIVLTDTMEATFNDVIGSANEGIDVIVRSESSIDGDSGEARDRIDASVVDEIEAVDGVAAAHGSIQGFAQLVTADGEAEEANGPSVTIGANWVPDEGLNPFRLETGRAPEGPTEMVLDTRTAEAEGWGLGDQITLLSLQGPTRLELVGTVTYGTVDGLPGTSLVATDDATAQDLFGEPGTFDLVVVAAADGVSAADLTDRLTESLGRDQGLEVVTGEQDTADKQADLKEDLSFFNSFLMAFAYVALFVGTFIIYNTFSIVVAQRIKDLAMLRAIGASRGQVLRSVVLESVLVGIVAAAIGLVAGVGLSFALRALLAAVGLDLPSGDIVVATGTVVTAFVVGLVVSVGSAILPAALLRWPYASALGEAGGVKRRWSCPPIQSGSIAFAGFRFPPEVILLAVRWYLRFGLSYRDLEELLAERGIEVDHVTLYRWVQRFTPLIVDAARPRRHVPGDRWFVDETYVKVAGKWRYVFRAVDQYGQVIDVYVSPRRDAMAAERFFTAAIDAHGEPAEVTTDRSPALARAIAEHLPGALHDTTQYANNRVETDHGRLKARLRPMRGLKRDRSASVVIHGHAFIQNLRRGHYELGTYALPGLTIAAAFDELAGHL